MSRAAQLYMSRRNQGVTSVGERECSQTSTEASSMKVQADMVHMHICQMYVCEGSSPKFLRSNIDWSRDNVM